MPKSVMDLSDTTANIHSILGIIPPRHRGHKRKPSGKGGMI